MLGHYKKSDLEAEAPAGLQLFAETAWGWSELKVKPFLAELKPTSIVVAITEVTKSGRVKLMIPRRVQE